METFNNIVTLKMGKGILQHMEKQKDTRKRVGRGEVQICLMLRKY
jgi:hypothetical protein